MYVFVASRQNIHELPELRKKATALGFTSILVTNLIPHTSDLSDEILYRDCHTAMRRRTHSPWSPCVDLPQMDATVETGLVVMVPPFVEAGDSIKVNTETGEYLERA